MKFNFKITVLTIFLFVCNISFVFAEDPPDPTPPPVTPVPIDGRLIIFVFIAVFIAFFKIYKSIKRKTV